MQDLISRQAAIDAMNTRLEDIKLTWRGKVKKGEIAMYLDMRGVIETLPSAQPTAEPVRHGKWVDEGQPDDFFPHHAWRCSECGEQVLEIGAPWYKYCPNCGARMDEEE